jgi:putative ABC transport system permease protein
MNLLMIIRVAFRALVRNKMRAALTMLGIIIGVSAVIAMVSIGQGAQQSVQEQIASIGTNLLFVSAGAQNVGGVRTGTGDTGTNTLTVEDLDAIKREVPSVSMVTPTVNTRSQLIFGSQNWNTQIQGTSEQYPDIRKWTVQDGSFFTDADVRTAARVIVVGQTIADNLFPGTSAVGQTVRVKELPTGSRSRRYRVCSVHYGAKENPRQPTRAGGLRFGDICGCNLHCTGADWSVAATAPQIRAAGRGRFFSAQHE